MVTYSKHLQSNIFIATDEKLIEVKLLKETLTFETAIYEYEHNGEIYSVEVGRNSDRFLRHLFYASVRDFNDGVSIKPERMYQARVKGIEIENTEDSLRCYLWVFENNRPIRKYVKVLSLVTTKKGLTTINLECNDVYGSKGECLAFNKIVANDINGEDIDTNSGYIHQYITFTDEQKKSIEKLRKAIEEVNKTCSFACGYNGLIVFNGKHKISDYDWANDNGNEFVELYGAGMKLPIIDTNYMDNPVIVIK